MKLKKLLKSFLPVTAIVFFVVIGGYFYSQGVSAATITNLIISASSTQAGIATNFIGRTGTSWLFQFKNPSMISSGTSTPRGIAITWPNVIQGSPGTPPATNWDFSSATVFSMIATSTEGVTNEDTVVTTTPPLVVIGASSPTPKMIITLATTTPANTFLNLRVDGVGNPLGNQSSALSSMTWTVKTGTLTGSGPTLDVVQGNYDTGTTSSVNLIVRKGNKMVSDSSSNVFSNNTTISTTAVYTFTFKPTTVIPVNGKIVVVFPSAFNVNNAATTTADNDLNGGTAGATEILSMTTSTADTPGGTSVKKVTLTIGTDATTGGQALTVVLSGIVNPSSAGVYQHLFVYTLDNNNALLDGSPDSFDSTEYTNQSPPSDTVHIGGTNNVMFNIYKTLATGATTTLTAGERAQVKVEMGCPDKQFFVGSKYPDASGQVIFKNLLDCNYFAHVTPVNSTNMDFWNSFMQPSAAMIAATAGGTAATSTTSFNFKVANAVIMGQVTGGPADWTGNDLAVKAYNAEGFESYSPFWNITPFVGAWTGASNQMGLSATGTGFFAIKVAASSTATSTWKISFPTTSFSGSTATTTYWTLVVPDVVVGNKTTSTLGSSFVTASSTLVVSLTSGAGATVTDACVAVKRAAAGMMMGGMNAICTPNGGGTNANKYVFKVPKDSDIVAQIFRAGKSEEYPVVINPTGATTTKDIVLSAPSTSITVHVADSGSTAMNGVNVMARSESGFGFAQGMTDSSGNATLYVPSGSTYEVRGFSSFGPLGPNTGVAVGATSNLTVGASLKYVSGTVTANGVGVGGVNIGAHGTGSTTGGNGTTTNDDGSYKLYLPAGTYGIGGWSQTTGGLQEQAVTIAGSNTTASWTLQGQGTVQVQITNGGNLCYTVSGVESCKIFAHAFNTTTNKGNGTNTWTASGSNDRVATFNLPAGTYTLIVDSASGSLVTGGSASITVTAGQTTTVTYAAPTLVTVTGTITSGGDNLANIWVNKLGDRGFSITTGSDGTYTLKVPAGTYQMMVTKVGYMPQSFVDLDWSATATKNVTLAAAGATITGTVTGPTEGFVSAQNTATSSIWAGAPIQADGTYSLSVQAASTWTVYAEGPCYSKSSGLSATAGNSGKNITLTAISGCTTNVGTGQSVVPSAGSQVSNSKMVVDIPPLALGSGTTAVSVTVKTPDYVNVPSGQGTRPLTDSVQSIEASSGTSNITDLGTPVTITLSYSEADLPANFDESTIQAGYWDETNVRWETIPCTVNTTANTITFNTSHFTEFGPLIDGAPDTPNGLAAESPASDHAHISWTASTGATYYTLYRSLTDSNFTTAIATPTETSYIDTGLTADTRYYYEIAANNTNGESPNSASVTTKTDIVRAAYSSGGGGGLIVQVTLPTAVSVKINSGATEVTSKNVTLTLSAANASQMAISNSADFAGASFEPYAVSKNWTLTSDAGAKTVYVKFRSLSGGEATVSAAVTLKVAATSAVLPAPAAPAAPAAPVVSTGALKLSTPAVLQVKLGKSLSYGYSYANATGKTLKIKLHRVVTNPDGKVILDVTGTRTLAKGKSVSLTAKAAVAKNAPVGTYLVEVEVSNLADGGLLESDSFNYEVLPAAAAAAPAVSGVLTRKLYLGMSGNDVRALQTYLAEDAELYPEGKVTGYYGALTVAAMKRFQTRHGIDIVGWVGPKSLLKLQELMGQ